MAIEKELLSSLNKAIDVMDAYNDRDAFLSLDALSSITGFPKPTVFRIVQTFVSRGWMVQNPRSKKYGISFGMMKYARIATNDSNLIAAAEPHMIHIRNELNESVVLSVLDQSGYHVCIKVINNNQFVQFAHQVGKRMPLYAGGTGRCMLAFCSRKYREHYLDNTEFKKLASGTITDRKEIDRLINDVICKGYCISRNEVNENTESLSVPILSRDGELVACMNIASLIKSGNEEYYEKAIPMLKEAALKIRDSFYSDSACLNTAE